MKKKIFLIIILTFILIPTCVFAIDSRTVYVTNSGSKFHSYNCDYISSSSYKTTVSNAESHRIYTLYGL